MYWLDLLLAVPAIGIRYTSDFFFFNNLAEEILNTIKPFQKKHGKINVSHAPLNYIFNFENGFVVKVVHDRIVVDFSYITDMAPSENSDEVFRVRTKINLQNRYTTLLDDIYEITEKIIQKIAAQLSHKIKITRFGLIGNCDINLKLTPPGLNDYIEHVFYPWSEMEDSICKNSILQPSAMLDIKISPILKILKTHTDRLYLTININESIDENFEISLPPERVVKLILDWQRIYKSPLEVKNNYTKELIEMKDNALKCFTQFAEGNLNYNN